MDANARFIPSAQRTARHPSGVSQALRALSEDQAEPAPAWKSPCDSAESAYRFRVACTISTREHAYRLAFQSYRNCGYVDSTSPSNVPAADSEDLLVTPFDSLPGTATFLGEDLQGRPAGTATAITDSPFGLPCDEIYSVELDALREQGRRPVEISRLVIDQAHARSKELMIGLFNMLSVYTRRLSGGTDLVIEVNPRHAAFYLRLLGFEALGPERPCPRVQGAPAVLLGIRLSDQEQEIALVGGTKGEARGPRGRSLYAHFLPLSEEHAMEQFIARSHRPMTAKEREYFGVSMPVASPVAAGR